MLFQVVGRHRQRRPRCEVQALAEPAASAGWAEARSQQDENRRQGMGPALACRLQPGTRVGRLRRVLH